MKGYVKKTGFVQQNNDVQDYKNGTPFDVQKHPKGQKNSRALFTLRMPLFLTLYNFYLRLKPSGCDETLTNHYACSCD